MLESILRPGLQTLIINPVLGVIRRSQYSKAYLTPIKLTLASTIFGLLVPIAILLSWPWLAIILLLISGLFDILDGSLARFENSQSEFGAVLDIISDRLVEVAVVLGLFFYTPSHRAVISILLLASFVICITSFLVVGMFSKNNSGKSFHYSPGLIERPETFIFFILVILLPSWFNLLGAIFVLLVLFTAVWRVYQFVIACSRVR